MTVIVFACCVGISGCMLLWTRRPAGRVSRALRVIVDVYARYSPPVAVSPARLQRRILRRMLESVTLGVRGATLVPAGYVVRLASADFESVRPINEWFCAELAAALRDRADRFGWSCPDRVVLRLAPDESRPAGAPRVEPVFDTRPTPVDTVMDRSTLPRTEPGGIDRAELAGPAGVWAVRGATVLGRSASCTIALDDERVSRRHCRIDRDAGGWFVEDLGSRNGTTCSGAPVHGRHRLRPGDVLDLGGFALRFGVATGDVSGRRVAGTVNRAR
jgi:hypothetical protein